MKFIKLPLVLLLLLPLVANGQKKGRSSDHNFDVAKNFEIYFSLFKELDMFYVDSIQPQALIQKSVTSMLENLDPYTNYIPESAMKDFMFITTGEYGGVGSLIGSRKGKIFFSEPYEGKPAQRAGIKAGDVILEINGQAVKDKNTSEVSELLKGQPGTIVKLKIERKGETDPLSIEINREKIFINAVSYSGVVAPEIGYIQISSFTDKASSEFKEAFYELKNKQKIKKLVIDLRNNGGGIMEEAINIVNFFVPKGREVVSTKGKVKQWDRTYLTTREPIDTQIPIVVLVNQGSASASEILSGALQDMDRAVIVGEKTFGKGLVQTTRPLPYNGSLKVTTAKYYIPSGRCVQAIDYSSRNTEEGAVRQLPDSLTNEFRTKNGRIVRDGGGISPDIQIKDKEMATVLYYLLADNVIFDFATDYVQTNATIPSVQEFALSDADFEAFVVSVKGLNFQYDKQSLKVLDKLKETAKFEGYFEDAKEEFQALESKLNHDVERSLRTFRKEVSMLLEHEIVKRYYHQKGVIEYGLKEDSALIKSIEVLNNPQEIARLLGPTVETKGTAASNQTTKPNQVAKK